MNAAPGPRFRDQLAAELFAAKQAHDGDFHVVTWEHNYARDEWYALADALMPVIAAEVEARVQAAAEQQAAEERAYVWIDPARRSGEPCIGGHRLSVELVIEHVWEGGPRQAESIYNLSRGQVLAACWYAGVGYPVRLHAKDGSYRPHRGPWAKRWGAWAAEVHQALWETSTVDYDAIPDPPAAALARPVPPEATC